MKHLFVNYDIAKQLKTLGFDEPCFGLYNQIKELCYPQLNYGEWKSFIGQSGTATAPTHQQVFDWFREKHGLIITILQSAVHTLWLYNLSRDGHSWRSDPIDNYYTALNAAIDEAIKLIKI